jgi:hypothetical protein
MASGCASGGHGRAGRVARALQRRERCRGLVTRPWRLTERRPWRIVDRPAAPRRRSPHRSSRRRPGIEHIRSATRYGRSSRPARCNRTHPVRQRAERDEHDFTNASIHVRRAIELDATTAPPCRGGNTRVLPDKRLHDVAPARFRDGWPRLPGLRVLAARRLAATGRSQQRAPSGNPAGLTGR